MVSRGEGSFQYGAAVSGYVGCSTGDGREEDCDTDSTLDGLENVGRAQSEGEKDPIRRESSLPSPRRSFAKQRHSRALGIQLQCVVPCAIMTGGFRHRLRRWYREKRTRFSSSSKTTSRSVTRRPRFYFAITDRS